jgi:hypothetical protein
MSVLAALSVAVLAASAAYANPTGDPLRIAAIAYDSFGFKFMLHPF